MAKISAGKHNSDSPLCMQKKGKKEEKEKECYLLWSKNAYIVMELILSPSSRRRFRLIGLEEREEGREERIRRGILGWW